MSGFELEDECGAGIFELNNWHFEQLKKLKAFQEAERKLLDQEHQKVFSSVSPQSFDQRYQSSKENNSRKKHEEYTSRTKSMKHSKNFNSEDNEGVFHIKYQSIKLKDPKMPLFEKNESDEFYSDVNENIESKQHQPKTFLKRGDGLARFRMTLEDFKGLPKIYKERKIKTYLNDKPEFNFKHSGNKTVKSVKKFSKGSMNSQSKVMKSVPVNIYVPETKTKKCNTTRNTDFIQNSALKNCKNTNLKLPKTTSKSLVLKPPCTSSTELIPSDTAEKQADSAETKELPEIDSCPDVDVEKKKDEKELKIFEILEQKVADSSFCSTSSFVDRLLEQSVSSTPSKLGCRNEDVHKMSYAEGLRSLRSQFLNEEQIKKFGCLEDFSFDQEIPYENAESVNNKCIEKTKDIQEEEEEVDICQSEFNKNEIQDKFEKIVESTKSFEPLEEIENLEKSSQPHITNKNLLQEYIKNFKKFKHVLAENVDKMEEPKEDVVNGNSLEKENDGILSQREISLKLQRKGLQDNVKHLLNWECPSRKRQPKRIVKKNKMKPIIKSEKSKVSEKDGEKIVFNSTLLKIRLDELEKEINIFRKENRNLELLKKECNEERTKLAREKKEFEKQMQKEEEEFEAKIAEENKKLQRDRTVFEKYCKQIKNQPTKAEREEITNLKKEIEKLTETLSTKESRWGASQARLRNQIKILEKENLQLKAENEKFKTRALKKVTFASEKNINTKIIHAINSELGKLKSEKVKNDSATGQTKNRSLSARIERPAEEKPIRRIKSAPNVKKQAEAEALPEIALGSVSTDSGIEMSGSRCGTTPDDAATTVAVKILDEVPHRRLDSDRSISINSSGSCGNEGVESVVREAVFGHFERSKSSNSDLEKREKSGATELEKPLDGRSLRMRTMLENLLHDDRNCERSELSLDSAEECFSDDCNSEEEADEPELLNCCQMKNEEGKKPVGDSRLRGNYIIESKIDESGFREKIFEDGAKEICYPNGNIKKIFPGNKIVKMMYYNGDVKETNIAEGSEKYYYAETKTWHTTYKDGFEVLEFPNGQTERRHPNGSTEISFPNGCVRYCDSFGRDEWRFLDGTVIKTDEKGHKILLMPNGQKEIHTKEFKRREYPDGTIKILYADGTQETRYSSGRVRLKSKEGNLLMDSGGIR